MAQLYEKLQAGDGPVIRLVILEDFKVDTNEIICRLETVRLNETLDYRALSYFWGDNKNPSSIICNGIRLKVTQNLNSALHCLLRKGKDRGLPLTFWIDAICINQEDLEERKQQVMLMGDIYRQAVEVIVWLGPAADNSDMAIELCRRLCYEELELQTKTSKNKKEEISWSHTDAFVHIFFNGKRQFHRRGIHQFVRELDAVQAVLMRPWWSRVWIIQEVSLARRVTIVCGDAIIEWETLEIGINACRKRPASELFLTSADFHHANVLFQSRRIAVQNHECATQVQYSLCQLLSQFRWSKATDPRDKVYGLLGLANAGGKYQPIGVDYRNDVELCYRTAMYDIISSSGSLDILQLCRKPPGITDTSDQNALKLPSWVPDLSMDASKLKRATELLHVGPIGRQSWPSDNRLSATAPQPRTWTFNASSGSVENCLDLKGAKVLTVQGLIFDTITAVGEMQTGAEARGNPRDMEDGVWHYIREARSGNHSFGKFFKSALSSWKGVPQALYHDGAERLLVTNWRQLAFSQKAEYPTGESLTCAFINTLHQGWLGDEPERKISQYNKEWKRIQSKVDAVDQCFLLKGLSKQSRIRRSIASLSYWGLTFFKDAETSLNGQALYLCFSVTELGYFALVPPEAREGDTIAIFKGGPVPFVIRPKVQDNGEARWELIGPCYVHGVMHGEEWNEDLCQPISLI